MLSPLPARCAACRIGVLGHAIGGDDVGTVIAGTAQRRNDAEILARAVMADDDVGLLLGDRLRERREVSRRDRENDLIPGAARGFDSLLVVAMRRAAADAVERHADDLAASA